MENKYLAKALVICEQNRAKNERTLLEHKAIAYQKSEELFKIDNLIRGSISKTVLASFNSDQNIEKTIDYLKNEHKKLIEKRKILLSQNNLPSNYLDLIYDCKICKDYGYVGTEPCECVKKSIESIKNEQNTSVLSISNQTFDKFNIEFYSKIPNMRYKMSPFDNAIKIYEKTKNYADNFGLSSKNMLFSGESGLGKTFLSTAIANTVAKKDFSVVYDTAINVFEVFEAKKFGGNNLEISEKAKIYEQCDLLIIDDLGTELTTSFTTSVLYNVINSRLMAQKPMILSTNLTLSELAKKYTSAISSRLEGEFNLVYFFGDDIRKIKKNL